MPLSAAKFQFSTIIRFVNSVWSWKQNPFHIFFPIMKTVNRNFSSIISFSLMAIAMQQHSHTKIPQHNPNLFFLRRIFPLHFFYFPLIFCMCLFQMSLPTLGKSGSTAKKEKKICTFTMQNPLSNENKLINFNGCNNEMWNEWMTQFSIITNDRCHFAVEYGNKNKKKNNKLSPPDRFHRIL